MSIDTSLITSGVTDFVNRAVMYVPLGINIVIIPVEIIIGMRFARKVTDMVINAFGGPDRGGTY